jgi:hypothetical protein
VNIETFPPGIFSYDPSEYNFRKQLCGIFGVDNLEDLGISDKVSILQRGTDQSTEFHREFYERFDEIRPDYLKFIGNVIEPRIDEPFCYQAVPTFRVHLPGNVAVGEFHTDGDYNHSPGEINYWVPFTPVFGTNSVFIESSQGSGEFAPVEADYGDVVTFDAVRWQHGNKLNTTGQTRVSFDFRCVPKSLYQARGLRTVNTGSSLEIGDYFEWWN